MAIAVTTREGVVPSLADARKITLSAIRMTERAINYGMAEAQFGAFAVGGHQQHGGGRWAALSPTTVAIKTKLGYPRPQAPLIRSGWMSGQQRVKVQLTPLPNGIQYRIWAWNSAPYSGYHMRPTYNHWTGRYNPVRKPVSITGEDLNRIVTTIESQLLMPLIVEPEVRKNGVVKRLKGAASRIAGRIGKFFGRGK